MSEAKSGDPLNTLREQLGQDGYMLENAVSMVVSQTATVRGLFSTPIEAQFKLLDALARKPNKASQAAGRIEALGLIIGNKEIFGTAMQVGIFSSENQRQQLKKAGGRGFAELREIALHMTPPVEPGEQPVTLASKIQALSPKR